MKIVVAMEVIETPHRWGSWLPSHEVHLLECLRSKGRPEMRDCGSLPQGIGCDVSDVARNDVGNV